MRRLLALPLVAAALAFSAPAHASFEVCTPTGPAGACAGYICVDICAPEPFVYTYCQHPVPATVCAIVLVRGGGV